jgi:transposase, IS30 family
VIITALVITEVAMGRRPKSAEVRARFWSARASGATLREAARAAGVSKTTGHYWLRDSGGNRPRARRPRPALRLSLAEREEISRGLAAGLTLTAIARTLGRSVSTISREVTRNRGPRGYRAVHADRLAEARTRRPKPAKLAVDAVLRAHVEQRLAQRWSPQQISARLVCDFPDDPRMRVSHETIYTSLFVQARGALRAELTACLRTGRVRRRPQRRLLFPPQRIRDKVMISQRPVEAADRAVAGHWEGDLIVGKHNKSFVGTLVERSTRLVVLLHLPAGPSNDQVIAALAAKIAPLPAHLRRSVTWDQGIEMINHTRFTRDTGVPIYFAEARSPWQRGSNENTNGLLRQYLPKGTDLRLHSGSDLDAIAQALNNRPRQTLGWKTPYEAFTAVVAITA